MAMSKDHKAKLAEGRRQARAVRDYLAHLEASSKRGPKQTPEKVEERLAQTREQIEVEDDPAKRVELIQQRMDDEDLLSQLQAQADGEQLESAFVDAAAAYSERKGISYSAWREFGVPAATLRAAGVPRARRT